ncbi:MAG: AAA family ATPase [Armatimonadota bacterium]|nr:AAA family ATPase [Armatimonadota bacterium]
MLTRLIVRNYRCLEEVEVPLGPLTAFVGPNGSGKTAILQALNILLGETWPSLRSFRIPQDFTAFDPSRELEIVATFDPPYEHKDKIGASHSICSIKLLCRPYKKSGKWGSAGDLHVDLQPLDEDGKVPDVAITPPRKGVQPQFQPLSVGTDLRDHARILYIDHRRSLSQHWPNVRGSILGKLLQDARKEFKPNDGFSDAYKKAMECLRTERVCEIENVVKETAKRMLGFLGTDVASAVDIGFGFADPANPFGSLRLEYREPGLTVPGDELSPGFQSAIVVGIFEAFRRLGASVGTVVIEEPEMYLHPQAQRYFYKLLCDMADKGQCQVIYSTHSPIFADVNRFETLRLIRRGPGVFAQVDYVRTDNQAELEKAREGLKLSGKFDPARNEVLFARRALLVEGFADRIAALITARKNGEGPRRRRCSHHRLWRQVGNRNGGRCLSIPKHTVCRAARRGHLARRYGSRFPKTAARE